MTTPADHEGPCPHCGDAGETGCNDDGKAVWYQCNVCGMRGPRVRMTQRASADDLFALALAGWNRLSGLREACEAVLCRLDYVQNLWGKEGVTERIAQTVRAALGKDNS